jgi:integrase
LPGRSSDLRDAALIGILYGAGVRRAEVVSLDVADYNPETGAIIVRSRGDKERIAFVAAWPGAETGGVLLDGPGQLTIDGTAELVEGLQP